MLETMRRAYTQVVRPVWFILLCLLGVIISVAIPTDLQSYRTPHAESNREIVLLTENYLRFSNTIVQVALPLLLRDKIGIVQLVYTGVASAAATHGMKRLANRWIIWGNRLGERPNGNDSQHNMPSGHSSMASCAAYFVCRRYGIWHALYLIPVLLLTMYARVALHAHTIPAVTAGAFIGLMMAAFFTSRR